MDCEYEPQTIDYEIGDEPMDMNFDFFADEMPMPELPTFSASPDLTQNQMLLNSYYSGGQRNTNPDATIYIDPMMGLRILEAMDVQKLDANMTRMRNWFLNNNMFEFVQMAKNNSFDSYALEAFFNDIEQFGFEDIPTNARDLVAFIYTEGLTSLIREYGHAIGKRNYQFS